MYFKINKSFVTQKKENAFFNITKRGNSVEILKNLSAEIKIQKFFKCNELLRMNNC